MKGRIVLKFYYYKETAFRRSFLADKEKKSIFRSNRVRAAVFLCLIAVIFLLLNKVFCFADAEKTNTIFEQFYATEEDTVDMVYFGTSATQRAFVVPWAYHNYGVAAFSVGTGRQPFVLTRYLMEEAEKTQDPKLFIVELRGICKGPDDIKDVPVRRVIDNMKNSRTKYDAVKCVTEYASNGENSVDDDVLSYFVPLIKYHGRWNPSKQPDYTPNVFYYHGYTVDCGVCYKLREIFPFDFTDEAIPVAPEEEEVLNELLDYCDSLDAEVLFVVSPYEATEAGMRKLNYAQKIVEDRGYEVLNFLSRDMQKKIGVADKTSYYNREHLNLYGSLLYTDFLSQYIQKNYGIPDRRGDGVHDSWEADYQSMKKTMEETPDYVEKLAEMKKGLKALNETNVDEVLQF